MLGMSGETDFNRPYAEAVIGVGLRTAEVGRAALGIECQAASVLGHRVTIPIEADG